MVTEPHNFLHIKVLEEGKLIQVPEEGRGMLVLDKSTDQQKYFGKKQVSQYHGYNHAVDLKNDPWLNNLGREDKTKFQEEMMKEWKKSNVQWVSEENWYMVMEGQDGRQVKLYQDKDVFQKARDAPYKKDAISGEAVAWSYKGGSFPNLHAAKLYIQMARDEEGRHWKWPEEIPVIWKNGPLTRADIETFPGFEEFYDEAP